MAHVVLWSGLHQDLTFFEPGVEFAQRPMGCYQLAWWLRKHRFTVQVIDYTQLLTSEELVEITKPFIDSSTICLGMSTSFWPLNGDIPQQIDDAINTLRHWKPDLKIVLGGAGTADKPQYDRLGATIITDNYAEDSFLAFCIQQAPKLRLPPLRFDITSLEHRFIKEDAILPGETLPLELGRGCIFKCKFCNYFNIGKPKNTYQRRFDLIIDEMKYNFDTFGVKDYVFVDDTVNEDIEKVRNMATFEQRLGFKPSWVGYCRADLIARFSESAELLRQSGLVSPFFGIETFHPQAAKVIGKGWSAKKAADFLPELFEKWDRKVNMKLNFIVGLPFEPIESIEKTVEWNLRHKLGTTHFYPLAIKTFHTNKDNHSEFSKDPAAFGYEITDRSTGEWTSTIMTRQQSILLTKKFNAQMDTVNRPACFFLPLLKNLGVSHATAQAISQSTAQKLALNLIDNFKQKYISNLRACTGS